MVPFFGRFLFEIRNRLGSSVKNQLPFCALKIAYQSKNRFSDLFKFKERIPKYLAHFLFTNLYVVAATQLITVKLKDKLLEEHLNI